VSVCLSVCRSVRVDWDWDFGFIFLFFYFSTFYSIVKVDMTFDVFFISFSFHFPFVFFCGWEMSEKASERAFRGKEYLVLCVWGGVFFCGFVVFSFVLSFLLCFSVPYWFYPFPPFFLFFLFTPSRFVSFLLLL